MLVEADNSLGNYVLALNNASGAAELISDLSYLEDKSRGILTFDFTHMAAPLTQEKREDYLPAGFGYQPTHQLLEVVCAIADYTRRGSMFPHELVARLPAKQSRIGAFLHNMHLPQLLSELGLRLQFTNPATVEMGQDDRTRQNLIPLTAIAVSLFGPDFKIVQGLHSQIEGVFRSALPAEHDLAKSFASIVIEGVDNCIEYGQGGIIGGLYYPRVGEVEISLVNSYGGFGGTTPTEQLEALVAACEGQTQRSHGGGNGIAELSQLALTCFGTLMLRNGHATLRLPPDGSMAGTTEETGFSTLGASVTLLLQLLPTASIAPTPSAREFEAVLRASLTRHATRKTI